MSEVRVRFAGSAARVFRDDSREIDVEGAIRAGKTTVCLHKVLSSCLDLAGIHWLIARWSDDSTDKILKPIWRSICASSGVRLAWNGAESYDQLANGSRVYITGLKAQDATQRYGKFRGLTIARAYIDQAEEMPQDVYLELVGRLSQTGYTPQIILSPQTVNVDHWIADEFPADRELKPGRAYYALSTHDNAHNLPPEYISTLEMRFPRGTPQHTTLILGRRGATIIGDPVYGASLDGSNPGSFLRTRHEVPCAYDARLGLEIGLDFGKHHPCVVFRQVSPLGQTRYLGGLLGHDVHLDPFLHQVARYQALWFPNPCEVRWCCDPAGMSNPIGVDMTAMLRGHGIIARVVPSSNTPAVRLALIERMAARMRTRDLSGGEAFVVAADERWLRISAHGEVTHRMVADALEFGYVWDEHMVSSGNKQMRKPKKDGWHEHPMNVLEYLEANFGHAPAPTKATAPSGPRPVLRGDMAWAG